MEKIISQFDYNLTLKANKNQLDQFFETFSNKYLTNTDDWEKIIKITNKLDKSLIETRKELYNNFANQ